MGKSCHFIVPKFLKSVDVVARSVDTVVNAVDEVMNWHDTKVAKNQLPQVFFRSDNNSNTKQDRFLEETGEEGNIEYLSWRT